MTDHAEECTPILIPFEKARRYEWPTDGTLSENPTDDSTAQNKPRMAKLDDKLANGLSGAAGGVIQGANAALKGLNAFGNASAKVVDAIFKPTRKELGGAGGTVTGYPSGHADRLRSLVDIPTNLVNDLGDAAVEGAQNTANAAQAGQSYQNARKTYDFADQFEGIFTKYMPAGMDLSTLDSNDATQFTQNFTGEAKALYDKLKKQYAGNPEAISQLDTVFTAYIDKLKGKSSSIQDDVNLQNATREYSSAIDEADEATRTAQTAQDFMQNATTAQANMDALRDPAKKRQWEDFKAFADLEDSGIMKREGANGVVFDTDLIRDGNNRKMGEAGFDANSAEIKYDLMDEGTLKKMEQFYLENKMNDSYRAAQQALIDKQNLMTEGGDEAYMETTIDDPQNTDDIRQMLADQGFTVDPSDTLAIQEMNKTMVPYLKGLGIPKGELDGFIKRGGLFSTDPNDLQYIKLISDGMAKKRSTDENYYKNLNDAAGRALNGTLKDGDLELLKEEAVFQHVNAV